ncbi:hypothetical protein BD626DRAFT_565708 [Schizophyllum amplum]|uniref:Uncharacterized protein n=1 Tax=Schizophyllum amplum TaxID=97359 RepID=A0A550CP96_9AGAR|nr:hypothetical protein BD626DRAFT_565708 [Auriculariopsis ampla]
MVTASYISEGIHALFAIRLKRTSEAPTSFCSLCGGHRAGGESQLFKYEFIWTQGAVLAAISQNPALDTLKETAHSLHAAQEMLANSILMYQKMGGNEVLISESLPDRGSLQYISE